MSTTDDTDNRYRAWGSIGKDYRTTDADGVRWVMVLEPGVGTCLVRWHGPRGAELMKAARVGVTDGWTYDPLREVLPGGGLEVASPGDVAIVSAIVGRDLDAMAHESLMRPNVALLRSQLKRWAISERNASRAEAS